MKRVKPRKTEAALAIAAALNRSAVFNSDFSDEFPKSPSGEGISAADLRAFLHAIVDLL